MVYSLKNKLYFKLYKQMYRTRSVEIEIAKRYSEGKMRCPTHLSIGQEAVPSVFSLLSKKSDFAVSSHRGHAHYLAKGGNLKSMIAEIYGKKTGCSKGKGGSMHLVDLSVNFMGTSAIVGNSIPVGVGLALSSKIKKKKDVSFVFFGDGAVEEGVFYESVNFALVKKLPVVFICENNFYSVYSPLSVRQPKGRSISKMVKAMGAQVYNCDGNDPLKIFKVLSKAVRQTRRGAGPCFLEFFTYRWLEHCGPNFDNNLNYRTKKEFLYWKKKDPLTNLKKKLDNKTVKKLNNYKKKVKKEIENAFNFANKSPFPKTTEAFKGVYAKK